MRRAARRRLPGLRRRPAHLRRRPSGAAGCSRGPARRRRRAAAAGSGCCFPTGVDFVLAWLAAVRIGAIAVPISTFSTARELRDLCCARRRRPRARCARLPGQRLRRRARRRGGIRSPPASSRRATAPSPRRTSAACGSTASRRSEALAAADVPDAVLDAVEDDVTPDDRMVIVHTSGSTSAPKGVIHQHGPLLGHLDNAQRDPRPARGGRPVLELADVLDRWARVQRRRRARRRRHAPVLGGDRPGRGARLHRAGAPRAHQRLRGVDRGTWSRTRRSRRRDFSSIRSGNLYPFLPAAIRPTDPELRHNMLGMTETGSVCLMSGDETDQPEHRRGSFGRPVPGLDAPRRRPRDARRRAGRRRRRAVVPRARSLMEGYYGRERYEIFTPDGWYRTGDLFHVDADGFFYFHGRRGDDDQDRGRERVAASRSKPRSATRPVGSRRWCSASPDPERDQVVAAVILRRTRHRPRSRRAAHRAAHAALGVQGAAPVPRARARRPADAVERQARPRRDRGAVRVSAANGSAPCRRCVRRWAEEQPDARRSSSPTTTRSPTASSSAAARALGRGTSPTSAWARARASGVLMPNGTAWPVVAFGAMPRRRHARAAQHLPPPARARGAAAHRRGRAPRVLPASSSAATTSPTSMAISPELVAGADADGRRRAAAAHDHGVGRPTVPCRRAGRDPSSSPRSTRRCGRPTTSPSCSRPGAAARRRV